MIRHRRVSLCFVVYMVALLAALITAMIMLMTRVARASEQPTLPSGITCEMVKAKVAEHGYLKSVYWARSQGYSWAQIKIAKRCLR